MSTEAPPAPAPTEGAPSSPAPAATPAAESPPAAPFLAGKEAPAAAEPPATPSHFFGDHVQKDGKFQEGWTNSISEKFPALANSLMRYDTEEAAFQGLDNALRLIGKKQTGVSFPKAGASPDEIAAFRKDAGVPETADGYTLKPETLPDGVAWDDASAKAMAEVFHANHIPGGAAKAMVEAHLSTLAAQAKQQADAAAGKLSELVQQTTDQMRQEWGGDFDTRLTANQDFIAVRLGEEAMADPALQYALSHPALVRIVDEARRAGREQSLPGVNGAAATGSMSPGQQAAEIIKQNPRYNQDPALSRQVMDLFAQQSRMDKRAAGKA